MASSERERRHNPTRTEIPHVFVDLGKLFDEDSRREYLQSPTGGVPNGHVIAEARGSENAQSEAEGVPDEDFMIG